MTTQRVKYESDESGFWWVDGDKKGEPQKDLHHAMKDREEYLRKEAQSDAEAAAREAGSTDGHNDTDDYEDEDEEADTD